MKFLNPILANVARNLPLRTVLIVPFVLQIVGTVGLVGYLSYKNGQRAVENLAYQLIDEVDKRVEQNVYHYLEIPHQVTQNLAAAIRTGVVDWKKFPGLERYFAQQLQIYGTVSSVAIATEEREFLAVEKSLASDSLVIRVLDKSTNYAFDYYTANLQGQRIKRTQVRYDFDPHNDPPQGDHWYQATKQADQGIWRPVVNLSQGVEQPLLMIANFLPFNDLEGTFQGVLAATFFVPELAEFLEGVEVGKAGQVFIINQKGEFVASSTGEIPFKPDLNADYLKNLNPQDWGLAAQNSSNPLTKASVKFLLNQVNHWSKIKSAQKFKFTFKDNRYFLQINPIQEQSGLNWLIITVVPESDFMAEIYANTRTTIGLCVAALIVSIVLGISTARWVTKPILKLNKAADAIARGEWEQPIAINRGDEVGQLAESFQTMAVQLKQYFTQLQSSNQALSQSESRLTQILEAIPVGISVHDVNGQLTYANEKSKELLGIETLPDAKTEELAATYQVYQSESQQLYPVENMPVVRALNGEKTIVEDLEIHQPDQIVSLEVYGTPLLDQTGTIIGAIAAFADITERKRAETLRRNYNRTLEANVAQRTAELVEANERLQQEMAGRQLLEGKVYSSEQQIRTIFEAINDIVLIIDHQKSVQVAPTKRTYLSPEDSNLLNVIIEQFFEDAQDCWFAQVQQVLETGQTIYFDYNLSWDNRQTWFTISIAPLSDQSVIWVARDISDRKLAEDALRTSEYLYRAMARNFPNGAIFLFDHNLRYLVADGQALAQAGYSWEALRGKTLWEVLPPENSALVEPLYHAALAGIEQTQEISIGGLTYLCQSTAVRNDAKEVIAGMVVTQDITERKQFEQALMDSENRFQEIASTVSQFFFVRSASSGKFLYVSPAYETMWGRSCESLYQDSESWIEAVHPEDRQLVLNSLSQQFQGHPVTRDYRIIRADGEQRWINADISLVRDEAGEPLRLVGLVEDITERKQAEIELQSTKERLQYLLTASPAVIFSCQATGDFSATFMSENASTILGYDAENFIHNAQFWWVRVYPEDKMATTEGLPQLFAQGYCTYEYRFHHGDGTYHWLATQLMLIRDETGTPVECVGYLIDITERKQAEEALREREEEYRRIVETADEGIWSIDLDGNTIFVNPKMAQMLGYSVAQMQGMPLFAFMDEEGKGIAHRNLERRRQGIHEKHEFKFRRRDGSQLWTLIATTPICDSSGHCTGTLGMITDISDRKQAELALAASKARFAGILEIANDGIISVDAQQRITLFNQGAEKMFGYKADQVLGQPLDLLLPPRAATIHRQHVTNFAESVGTARQMGERNELFGRRQNGTEFPTEASISKLEINGEILCTAILRDISDRKAAELALSQQKEILQTIFDYLPIMLCFYKDGGDVHFVNPAFEQTLGWSLEELRDMDIMAEAYPDPDYRASVLEFMLKADGTWQDFQVTTRTGEILETTWANIRLPDGSTVGIGQDITERKQAELALQEREYRLRTLADNLPNGLIYQLVHEPNGKVYFSYITAGIERLVGIKPEVILQDASVLHNLIVEEDRLLNQQLTDESLRNLSVFEMQMRKRTASGEIQWSYLRSAPRRLEDGRTVWDGIEIDITELKKTEIELAKAKDAAEGANRAKSAFLASMSHELRTPLNGILGYAQILKPNPNLTQKQKDGIEIIYQCGQHLLTLINDILDLSKVEAGKLELYPEEFHFPSFIVGLCEIFRLKSTQKDITFIYHAPTPMPQVIYGDEKRLRQVLMNLLSNAVKFTDTGSVTFTVIVEIITTQDYGIKSNPGGLSHIRASHETIDMKLAPTDSTMAGFEQRLSSTDPQDKLNPPRQTQKLQKIRFQIEDTGIGMSSEHLQKIFLPFEQIKESSRRHEGTGLGLAITHKLVALMGSKIGVESTLGVGSKFWFEVDLPEVHSSAEFILAKPMDMIVGYSGAKRKILIVDDRWENCAVLKSILEPLSFEVQDATNGREGLEKALELQPDLILVDIVMPVMDGHQMTQQLRQLSEFRNTPIIAISANAFANNRVESLDAGCNDFLTKPIATTDLLQKIQVYLNVSWVYQAKAEQSKQSSESGDMVIPSQEELAALYEAASMGDVAGVEQETMGLQDMNPDYIPFALEVLEMAANFDYEKIVNLLDNCFGDW